MNMVPIQASELFSLQLDRLVAPLVAELCRPEHVEKLTSSQDGYRSYLKALYGVLREAFGLIDWDLLGTHGLPNVEQRKAVSSAMMQNIGTLVGVSWSEPRSKPSIRATFGVSLGMLYSIEEGARAGRRMSRLAPGFDDGMKHVLGGFRMDFAVLQSNLTEWEDGLVLTETHRDEAQFAARACLEFARRHLRFSD